MMVGIKDERRLQAGSKCKHLQLHLDTLASDDGKDFRAHKVILMNPGDGLGPSINTHTCILQPLMVVGVEDELGPGVNTHPCYFCL